MNRINDNDVLDELRLQAYQIELCYERLNHTNKEEDKKTIKRLIMLSKKENIMMYKLIPKDNPYTLLSIMDTLKKSDILTSKDIRIANNLKEMMFAFDFKKLALFASIYGANDFAASLNKSHHYQEMNTLLKREVTKLQLVIVEDYLKSYPDLKEYFLQKEKIIIFEDPILEWDYLSSGFQKSHTLTLDSFNYALSKEIKTENYEKYRNYFISNELAREILHVLGFKESSCCDKNIATNSFYALARLRALMVLASQKMIENEVGNIIKTEYDMHVNETSPDYSFMLHLADLAYLGSRFDKENFYIEHRPYLVLKKEKD